LKLGDKLIWFDLLLLLNITRFFCDYFYLKDEFSLRTHLAYTLGSKAVKMPIDLVKSLLTGRYGVKKERVLLLYLEMIENSPSSLCCFLI